MDSRHKYLIDKVACYFRVDPSNLTEAFQDYQPVIDDFLNGGVRRLFFAKKRSHATTQIDEDEAGDISEVESSDDDTAQSESPFLISTIPYRSSQSESVFCARISKKAVSTTNIDQEIFFGQVAGGLLGEFSSVLKEVYLPSMRKQDAWGELTKFQNGKNPMEVSEFLEGTHKFAANLGDAADSIERGSVRLPRPPRRLDIENSPQAYLKAASKTETVHTLEATLDRWIQHVELLLAESMQFRKETDDSGPSTELEYWKTRMAKFNSITDQLKEKSSKSLLGVLGAAKSKKLKVWKSLDVRITDAANEAKDNVKYLYTLERFCEPLYKNDPNIVVPAIPGLINAIKMIHSIARFYNTSERMTALFVKITNQMIVCCLRYVQRDGDPWDQLSNGDKERAALATKLQLCMTVYAKYRQQYKDTKADLARSPMGRQFDFSEHAIFGKFELFCTRINSLLELQDMIGQYRALSSVSLEGLEAITTKFENQLSAFRRKAPDLLEYKKADFDESFREFRAQIAELETALTIFINNQFTGINSVSRGVEVLQALQAVLRTDNLTHLLAEKHLITFANYARDLERIKKVYEKDKEAPPVQRNMPPVAGAIAWARQLMRSIEVPMSHFQNVDFLMQTKEAKGVIRMYNKVVTVLVQYESVWYEGWCETVALAKSGLNATLLVRHPTTGRLCVNFDPQVLQLLREARCLRRLGFDVPPSVHLVCDQEDRFKLHIESLNQAIRDYESLAEPVADSVYAKIAQPMIQQIEQVIEPATTVLTWSSLSIDTFLKSLSEHIARAREVLRQANDLVEIRLTANCKAIEESRFVKFEKGKLKSVSQFLSDTKTHTEATAKLVQIKNKEIEVAVHDLIELFARDQQQYAEPETAPQPSSSPTPGGNRVSLASISKTLFGEHHNTHKHPIATMSSEAKELVNKYEKMVYEAFLTAMKCSVESLKVGITCQTGTFDFRAVDTPVFKADVHLKVPDVVVTPSIEEVQSAVNRVARFMLESTDFIFMWSHKVGAGHTHDQVSYFRHLAENRTLAKTFLQLSGVTTGLQRRVSNFLKTFDEYSALWMENRSEKISKTPNNLEDFENAIRHYENVEAKVEALPPMVPIGCLAVDAQSIKAALKAEAVQWRQAFGAHLSASVKDAMVKLSKDIEEQRAMLTRKIEDLESMNLLLSALGFVREMESTMEMQLAPIDETYTVLAKHKIRVTTEEKEQLESIRSGWPKLAELARRTAQQLVQIGPKFRAELLSNVRAFHADVADLKTDYDTHGPLVPGIGPRAAVERLKEFKLKYDEKMRKYETYSLGEKLFGLAQTEYPELATLKKQNELLTTLYSFYDDVTSTLAGYEEVMWSEINIELMTTQVTAFQDRCRRMFKMYNEYEAYAEVRQKVEDFAQTLPLIQHLCHPAIRPRHWQEVSNLLHRTLDPSQPDLRIRTLLEANLLSIHEDVEDIAQNAIREAEIETKLEKIRNEWLDREFVLAPFKGREDLILKPSDTSDLMVAIEDTQMMLASLMSNRYNPPFRHEIQLWIQKLTMCQEVIDQWLKVQALWIYLEAVFSGGDIAREMPVEAKKFAHADKTWCTKIMGSISPAAAAGHSSSGGHHGHASGGGGGSGINANVLRLCYTEETLRGLLPHLFDSLELCQKSLSGYLEAKRGLFPRFFFVSDAQLLEILGQGSDPNTIQSHLLSVFANVARVEFDKVQKNKITHMISAEGEAVQLGAPILAEGNIEDWLNRLVDEQCRTIKDISKHMAMRLVEALDDAEKDKLERFVASYPAQLALLGIQIYWTFEAESALEKARLGERGAMRASENKFNQLLSHMVDLTTRELSPMERIKLESLITIHIHQADIFTGLVKARVRSPQDFEWLKQTRIYWRLEADRCVISVTDVDFDYCFEFLGCTERLVITPLTDRIYISCAQAMGMYYGGAPAGPAGTGKTETTKDMGRTCGKYFITINCSDQMDNRAMGKLFKGIAQSGLWCGFDEINRVDLEVLSVVAAQVACVFNAMREKRDMFMFTDGTNIKLDSKCGIFITMNPGYAGRTELPENMKALFRSIAVVVPDRQIIKRVRLAASGFQDNQVLAKKFFILYRLCEEQLSKQTHYDFGLRNILSVLRSCGSNKRANPTMQENQVLMRVLRDMNVSKLVDDDEPLFRSLIADLFPGLEVDKESYPDLQRAIANQVQSTGLVNHPDWNLKIIQLYEQWRVRHGLCIMGPSGSGKTECIRVLGAALTELGTTIRVSRMNPKAITATQMFGRLDKATNDWTDGVFSKLWRKSCDPQAIRKKGDQSWIILDGPVDAIWIENLNTVLDDTRVLTLANGDRLVMPPSLKLIFEVGNLDNASPATVSRMGMVYMGASSLGWRPIVEAWIKKLPRPDEEKRFLGELYNKHVDDFLVFLRDNTHPKMAIGESSLVSTSLKLFRGLLDEALGSGSNAATSANTGRGGMPAMMDNGGVTSAHVERLFVFALMWSLGGLLEHADRRKVHDFMAKQGLDLPPVNYSNNDTVYEHFVAPVSAGGGWQHWKQRVKPYAYPADHTPDFATILVPTVDNVRTEYLVDLVAKQRLGVLLIGEGGTAKTVTLHQYMAKCDPETVKNKYVCFSSATTCHIFQKIIESSVDKRSGNQYGPPTGTRMLIFIDDINMPEINSWGDQVTNEIVRQLVEEGGFYCLEKPEIFLRMEDISFLAAMNQPGGGRNDIPSRLKRHFAVFNVTLPSTTSVEAIYGTLIEGHFCSARGFNGDVVGAAKRLANLTRRVWESTKAKMLPTPSKFHYVFNLRDLSRIVQGLLKAESQVIADTVSMMRLWRHECDRVLPDKFISQEEVEWFDANLRMLLSDEFDDEAIRSIMQPTHFVDFLREAEEPEDPDQPIVIPKVYEPIASFHQLQERLEECLAQYNELNKKQPMDLCLFEFAMLHLMRISRILRTSRGNALLVGVGGSGKQSLTRLASFIAGYKTWQITITKTYNTNNLLEDLKALYKMAAISDPVTFLFTDNEIKEESFLEYVNMILTSGEIPGLFQKDELESLYAELRPVAKRLRPGFIETTESMYKFFVDRVRDNLHVVLCFSPVGEKFRNRARKFPGLISGCTIDWFSPWPVEALKATAHKFLEKFDIVADPNTKFALMEHMCHVHESVGRATTQYFQRFRKATYVTPKSYLSFLNAYQTVYRLKYAETKQLADRVNTGLKKLLEAADDVAKMKVDLMKKEKELVIAQHESDELLVQITAQSAIAEEKKNEVLAVKMALEAKAAEISAEKAEAEAELAAADPELRAAEEALNKIKAPDIIALKRMAKPPNLIKRILDGVLILKRAPMDQTPHVDPDIRERLQLAPSWESGSKMLSEMSFLQSLKNYDKDAMVNEETVELLQPYLDMPDFNAELATKASGSVAGVCTWVRSMVSYFQIAKKVAPKRERVRAAEELLHHAMKELKAAQAELDAKQKAVDDMKHTYDSAMAEKQRLQENAELTKRRLDAAEALITGLASERERWTRESKEFDDTIRRLIGDVAVACAFLCYAGPFNQEFRSLLFQEISIKDLKARRIPLSSDFDVTKFLVSESVKGEWVLQGLPSDELSTQNGIIVTTSARYPLLVDPQGQGKAWIKKREESNRLIVTTFNHKQFRTHLEDSLCNGRPLLIEDIDEEVDPLLDPILEKQFTKAGRGLKVRVGDKDVDVDSGFKLYMTTKLPNPHFTPETSAKTSIIDFAVTIKGLEDQLLGRVILRERADQEESRKALLQEITECKKTVAECEEDLLFRLSSTEGNLLDDTTLVGVLATTKRISQEVKEKLANSREKEQKILANREEFREVAARGSIMFFVVTELALVNCMYQVSLAQFLRLFDEAIETSEPSVVAARRVRNIIAHSTFTIFKFVQRGLYEKHKLVYSLLLALKIDLSAKKIDPKEFAVLLKGGAALDLSTVRKKPAAWIADSSWLNTVALTELPDFRSLADQVYSNEAAWKQWYDTEKPEDEKLPESLQDKLSKFHRFLLVRAWREDRAMAAATQYIIDSLGREYVEGIPLDLDQTWSESSPNTPIICLLSMGSDPTSAIEGLAKKKKIEVRSVSMGQGQEVQARKLVAQATAQGGWVLLQNCHLSLKFMSELEETLMALDPATCEPSFRVWITTEPHIKFPINLLQMGIKITNEPPQGLKAGLRRSYAWVTQDMIEAIDKPQWRPLLYTLCFLHSTVIERKKFGPLGWCVPYEFNHMDLVASAQFLQNHLYQADAKKPLAWNTIRYMICEVQYGGRITDDYDKRLLNTYGTLWFSQATFGSEFSFYKGYNIPDCKTVQEYRTYIDSLPLLDTPEIFGMHSNAELTYNAAQANEVLGTILSVQPKDSSGSGGETREDVVLKIANELLAKLPNDYNRFSVRSILFKKTAANPSPPPLNIFLSQEIDQMQNVLTLVRRTCTDLKLAIAGTIIMSPELQEALNALYDARVPPRWLKESWPSPTFGFWFNDVLGRTMQYTTWLEKGRPKVYWLTGFFNPQGFLTAMKQESTRRHAGWSLDLVSLRTDVLKQEKDAITTAPEDGVYIHGLFLEGAAWDKKGGKLVDSPPKALFCPLPVIHVTVVNTGPSTEQRTYTCPCYKIPRRTALNFIFDISLKTDDIPEKWTLRGVAALYSKS